MRIRENPDHLTVLDKYFTLYSNPTRDPVRVGDNSIKKTRISFSVLIQLYVY